MAFCELITIQGISHFISQDPQKLFDLMFSIRSNDLTIKSNLSLTNKSTVRLSGLGLYKLNHDSENKKVYIVYSKSRSIIMTPSHAQPHPTFVDLRDPELSRLFDNLPQYKPQEFASLSKAYTWSDLKEVRPDARQLLFQLKTDFDVPARPVPSDLEAKAES